MYSFFRKTAGTQRLIRTPIHADTQVDDPAQSIIEVAGDNVIIVMGASMRPDLSMRVMRQLFDIGSGKTARPRYYWPRR